MSLPAPCWRCEDPEHTFAECRRPPASSQAELDERIARILARWEAHQISTTDKRDYIEYEITAAKGEPPR